VLSGCDDRRSTGPGRPGWALVAVVIARSVATPGGHLVVLPLELVGISHVRGDSVDIGTAAVQLP
jgi:hypothetical protein